MKTALTDGDPRATAVDSFFRDAAVSPSVFFRKGGGGLGEGRAVGGGGVREGREGGGVQTSGQEFNREAACSVVINIMTCLFQGSFGHLPLSFSTLAKDVNRLVFLLQ